MLVDAWVGLVLAASNNPYLLQRANLRPVFDRNYQTRNQTACVGLGTGTQPFKDLFMRDTARLQMFENSKTHQKPRCLKAGMMWQNQHMSDKGSS